MANSSKAKKPCTPVCKRFLYLFRPTTALGKRTRNPSPDDEADAASRIHSSPVASIGLKRSSSVALQNEDGELEETVIITALKTIPFCCHEDLLTMTRPQLLAVAETLNSKLPVALRIDIKPSSTDSFVRNAIELIVGIKRPVPGAPKAVKLGLSSMADPDKSVSPPTSPLATKNRPRDVYQASPRLSVLKEEDEGTVMARPTKKRKVSGQIDIPVTKKRRASAQATVPVRHTRSTRTASSTLAVKTGPKRTRSQRLPASQVSPPRSSRVLRSHSQKLPAEMKNIEIDTSFITMQRPRYRFRYKAVGITNSTPPKGTFGDGSLIAQRDSEEGSPKEMDQEGFSVTDERSPSSTSTLSTHATPRGNPVWATGANEAPGNDADEDDDAGMTFGLHEMTMAASGSDMDMNS
ncbi:hypothetical protein PILCRDRAFT_822773 [Piloderma croceum F 1598]|uniref:Uncharacterized protein n=1 Tax=Piloderma croceum (strain F 1598) TaxID=765440 RepID=A0A0C3B236_PILCF|nr:hypothetical protein PILCRDRAFT_822773 [Piloderma croceum F 1598]